MSNLASFGSAQASSWAAQRKEAMEKAKALRSEKKSSLTKTGETTKTNYNHHEKNTLGNTKENPQRTLANTATYDQYGNQGYGQDQRNLRTMTSNAPSQNQYTQKGGIANKGKEGYMDSNPYSRGNVGYDEETHYQDYTKKPLNKTTQPLNQNNINQNYRQVYKPNINNEPQTMARGGMNQQQQLRTLPKENVEYEYDDYSDKVGYKQLNKERIENTRFLGQNNPSAKTQKPSLVENKGRSQPTRNEYGNTYDEPQMNTRQYGQNTSSRQYGQNYQQPTKQQYQPELQREYNPLNYAAKQSNNKGYSEDLYDQPKSRSTNYGNTSNGINQTKPPSRQIQPKDSYGNSSKNSMNSYSTNYEDDRSFGQNQKKGQIGIGKEKPTGSESLEECPEGCGRSFFPEALEKHARICQKVFQSKRKQFDTAQQRMTDDQVKVTNKKPNTKASKTPVVQQKKHQEISGNLSKQAKWKQESEAFRANMKAARGETLSKAEQKTIASSQQDSLIPCNYCGRRFNEKAAERHIPFCQSKQKDVALKKGPATTTNSKFRR